MEGERKFMKKLLAVLTIAALALTATVSIASAHENESHGFIKVKAEQAGGLRLGLNKFQFWGTVNSATSSSLVFNAKAGKHLSDLMGNGQVTVVINSDTKIKGNDEAVLSWADLKAGDKVIVSGSISGTVLTATQVRDLSRPVTRASGKVTAVTDNSITITNGLTGVSQTVTTNADTKVMINGESKTIADIQVGDSGWVKFKNEAGSLIAKFFNLFRSV